MPQKRLFRTLSLPPRRAGLKLAAKPAGWIITTARNRAIDRHRREASRADRQAQAAQAALLAGGDSAGQDTAPRELRVRRRLRLIFTCCHPALATQSQVALTLRLLGGLSTAEIAAPSSCRADHGSAARQGEARSGTRGSPTACRSRPICLLEAKAVLAVVYLIYNREHGHIR
jgi:RNA polymerase sigma-70 factor (ECF subfamily)